MRTKSRKIILIDQHIEMNPTWLGKFSDHTRDLVVLDPIQLFGEIDWTRYDEDVEVINQIYSRLFEEVVINRKRLVCFWPLVEQFGNDWFELNALCKLNQYELEIHKHTLIEEENYGFSFEILLAWKKFIYFMIESLLEDVQINEQFDEIATLTGDQDSIVLFKLEQNGYTQYSYSSTDCFLEFPSDSGLGRSIEDNQLPVFDSFKEMLSKLSGRNDLTKYRTKFVDKQLEKIFFNALANEFKTINLIQDWLKSYSLN